MSERVRNLLLVLVMAVVAGVLVFLVANEPTQVDRVESLTSRIKCPVCQGESIADSPSQMARDMVALVEVRVSEGATDQEILDEVVNAYSGALLLDPPASGTTLMLWLLPILALALGVVMISWWRRHPGVESSPVPERTTGRRRRSTRIALTIGGFAAIAVIAGLLIGGATPSAEGVANLGELDLDEVSNETMEAVIAANEDHPQVAGMRLALADRYFRDGDYRSAFPHYLAVAEGDTSTGGQVATALVGLGWMTWDGNGEATTALELFDEALEIDPGSTSANYLKGRVLWCTGDSDAASESLNRALDSPELSDDTRATVVADLGAIAAGETCR